jgi:lactoylglutathione lyase
MGILHTALRVSDLEATVAFYEGELGLAHSWDFEREGVTNYYVTGEGSDAEIQFVHDPDDDRPVDPSGIDHVAVSVDDVRAEFDRLVEEAGSEPVEGPTHVEAAGATVAFVTDPDGYVVELIEPDE